MDAARARKVSDRIARIVAEMLELRIKDPRLGFITVTDARLPGDLRDATVYYTVYGPPEERAATAAALESAKGVIRSEVGRQTGLRHTPSLTFVADTIPDNARHIGELLERARAADAGVARSRAGALPGSRPRRGAREGRRRGPAGPGPRAAGDGGVVRRRPAAGPRQPAVPSRSGPARPAGRVSCRPIRDDPFRRREPGPPRRARAERGARGPADRRRPPRLEHPVRHDSPGGSRGRGNGRAGVRADRPACPPATPAHRAGTFRRAGARTAIVPA